MNIDDIPEPHRTRILAAAHEAQHAEGMRTTAPWCGEVAFNRAVTAGIAAYRRDHETIDQAEAERRLHALNVPTAGRYLLTSAGAQHWLDAYRPDDFGDAERERHNSIAEVLRAFVRGREPLVPGPTLAEREWARRSAEASHLRSDLAARQTALDAARDLLRRARIRLVDEPDSVALDADIVAFLAGGKS